MFAKSRTSLANRIFVNFHEMFNGTYENCYWSSDFMAYVSEKIAFGSICLLCILFRFNQSSLNLFSFGDIVKCNNRSDHLLSHVHRVRKVFCVKVAPIRSPKNLIVNMNTLRLL